MTRQLPAPLRMVPMILVMGTIFYLSHQPGDTLDLPVWPGIDKMAHLLVYGLLAAATLLAFDERWKIGKTRLILFITPIFCLFYGITDEIHQSFVPGRFPSFADILADVAGAVLVSLVWFRRREAGQRQDG